MSASISSFRSPPSSAASSCSFGYFSCSLSFSLSSSHVEAGECLPQQALRPRDGPSLSSILTPLPSFLLSLYSLCFGLDSLFIFLEPQHFRISSSSSSSTIFYSPIFFFLLPHREAIVFRNFVPPDFISTRGQSVSEDTTE